MSTRIRIRQTACLLGLSLLFAVNAFADEGAREAKLRRLVSSGDYRAALDLADRLIGEEPESVLAHQFRAYSLHQLGREVEAESAYEKTLALDPENWWAWLNLGELFASRSRWAESVTALDRAVKLRPDLKDAWARLVRVLRESGDYETAAAKASGALEAGADEAACDHGIRLADWDRPRGTVAEKRDIARRRRGLGDKWEFPVGVIDVRTRVGPAVAPRRGWSSTSPGRPPGWRSGSRTRLRTPFSGCGSGYPASYRSGWTKGSRPIWRWRRIAGAGSSHAGSGVTCSRSSNAPPPPGRRSPSSRC